MKGTTASPEEIKARWAYSEILSPRFKAFYTTCPTHLLDLAVRGEPFSAVPKSDWPALVNLLVAARNASFASNIDGPQNYVCEAWDKTKLLSIYALPAFNPPLKQHIIPYSQFYAGAPNTGPNSTPEDSDPRVAVKKITIPEKYAQPEPVIAIERQGHLILLEGYLRSLLFLASKDPKAALLVWVPEAVNIPAATAGP